MELTPAPLTTAAMCAPTIDERFANDASMRARAHYLISQMYSNASLFEEARHHAIEALELLDELDE